MPFPRSAFFGVLLVGLALSGFGCKKVDSFYSNTTKSWTNGQVVLPTVSVTPKRETPQPVIEHKPDKLPDPEILRIRESMQSLQKSRSFKALITINGKDGIKGDITYSQANGLYGKLTLANGFTTEMAIIDKRVAVRNGSSTWEEVSGTPEAASIITLFQSITNRGTSKPIFPTENAKYVSAKDDAARDCRMHSVSQFMGNLGGYQPLQVCIKAGLPVYFSIPSEDGTIEIEYRDIDKPVDVFFPLP